MKLTIKEPCHENWDNMKIGMISRHCDVCEKSVMDFTTSSRAEIITYILSNRNDSTCGRMRRDQFEFHHEDIPVLIEVLKQKPRNNAFLILALVSLSLTACAQETTTEPINTKPENGMRMGKIAAPQPTDTTVQKPICAPIETGEIEMLGEVAIQGEIAPPEPTIQGSISRESEMIKGDIAYEPIIENPSSNILPFAEKMPEYPSGIEGLFDYMKGHFKSKNIKEKGSAYVRFVVNEDGTISDPSIIKIDQNLSYLSEDILKMILKMPNWVPGENDGKKVKVYYTMPVRFQ